ncbi:MAG: hypothetical protein EBX92_02360 [Actinobacteria bacterium]|nr:hypothetical protein [Actinomycetota bacterium]
MVMGSAVARSASTIPGSVSALTFANCQEPELRSARAVNTSASATLSALLGVHSKRMTGFFFDSGMSCSMNIRSVASRTLPGSTGVGSFRVLKSKARLN